jgi:hypothetical protein
MVRRHPGSRAGHAGDILMTWPRETQPDGSRTTRYIRSPKSRFDQRYLTRTCASSPVSHSIGPAVRMTAAAPVASSTPPLGRASHSAPRRRNGTFLNRPKNSLEMLCGAPPGSICKQATAPVARISSVMNSFATPLSTASRTARSRSSDDFAPTATRERATSQKAPKARKLTPTSPRSGCGAVVHPLHHSIVGQSSPDHGSFKYSSGTSVNPHSLSCRDHVPRLSLLTRTSSIGMIVGTSFFSTSLSTIFSTET